MCDIHYVFPITEVSSNSGRYSASTMPAITMPMNDQHRRLDHVTKRADLGLNFLVVKIREAVEHFGQRAGRLADFDHLDRDVGHDLAARAACSAKPWPSRTRDDHDLELLAHVAIAGRARRDLERVHQRNAAAEQRRQRARQLRGRELVDAARRRTAASASGDRTRAPRPGCLIQV